MEDQSQIISWVHQESLIYHTWVHDLDWPYGLYPTRYHPPSHWGSNPHNIMGDHCFCGPLIQLLICSPHEGNLSWWNPPGQGILLAPDSHPLGQVMCLQGVQRKIFVSPVQGGIPYLWTTYKILWGGISPPKCHCWYQDQVIDPR